MKLKYFLTVLTTGFALFAMFFGSGNLVFPLIVGQQSEGHVLGASAGILLTGVFVPFLGAYGMLLFKGNSHAFFSCLGRRGSHFWFPLLALSLMGPFGVLARCITVAHGSFQLLFPHLSLSTFALGMCTVIFLFTQRRNRIISILGAVLTPLLLLSLIGITIFGFINGSSLSPLDGKATAAFLNGLFQGYQTMDLLAAFFFAMFIIRSLQKAAEKVERPFSPSKLFLHASFLGMGLLSSVYVALVFLGGQYSSLLSRVAPQAMLGVIAQETLGSYAAPIVCLAIALACLTTAIALAVMFSDFVYKEISHKKLAYPWSMALTLLIAFGISNLEFSGISRFLGPLLEATYPALIMLTLLNIFNKAFGLRVSRWPLALTLLGRLCFM